MTTIHQECSNHRKQVNQSVQQSALKILYINSCDSIQILLGEYNTTGHLYSTIKKITENLLRCLWKSLYFVCKGRSVMQSSEASTSEVWEKQLNEKHFFTHRGAFHNTVSEEENSNETAVGFCINITLVMFCFVWEVSSREKKKKRVLSYLLVVRKSEKVRTSATVIGCLAGCVDAAGCIVVPDKDKASYWASSDIKNNPARATKASAWSHLLGLPLFLIYVWCFLQYSKEHCNNEKIIAHSLFSPHVDILKNVVIIWHYNYRTIRPSSEVLTWFLVQENRAISEVWRVMSSIQHFSCFFNKICWTEKQEQQKNCVVKPWHRTWFLSPAIYIEKYAKARTSHSVIQESFLFMWLIWKQ